MAVIPPEVGRAQADSKTKKLHSEIETLRSEIADLEKQKKDKEKDLDKAPNPNAAKNIGDEVNALRTKISAKNKQIDANFISIRAAALTEIADAAKASDWSLIETIAPMLKEAMARGFMPTEEPSDGGAPRNPPQAQIKQLKAKVQSTVAGLKTTMDNIDKEKSALESEASIIESALTNMNAQPAKAAKDAVEAVHTEVNARVESLEQWHTKYKELRDELVKNYGLTDK